MNFECPPTINSKEIPYAEKRERIFEIIACREIFTLFEDTFFDLGLEELEIQSIKARLSEISIDDLKHFYAVPDELRVQFFSKQIEKIKEANQSISEIVDSVVEINKRNGFTLGFHMSKVDIRPESKGWTIAGYELDDRDNLPMAYYSLDYTNAFRKRDPNFVYIVRADTKSNTHRKDLTNNWGRASSLAIITKLDVADIDKEVEQRLTEDTNETGEKEYKVAA